MLHENSVDINIPNWMKTNHHLQNIKNQIYICVQNPLISNMTAPKYNIFLPTNFLVNETNDIVFNKFIEVMCTYYSTCNVVHEKITCHKNEYSIECLNTLDPNIMLL